jgi:hypothetical protein
MRRRVRLTAGLGIHGDRDQPKGNAGEYENVRNDSTPNALEMTVGGLLGRKRKRMTKMERTTATMTAISVGSMWDMYA